MFLEFGERGKVGGKLAARGQTDGYLEDDLQHELGLGLHRGSKEENCDVRRRCC